MFFQSSLLTKVLKFTNLLIIQAKKVNLGSISTKGSLRKQITILIGSNSTEKIMAKVNTHISNINRLLKEVKSEILVDFIQSDNKRLFITTNKVATTSDINIIEKYMKNLNNIDSNNIMSLKLP